MDRLASTIELHVSQASREAAQQRAQTRGNEELRAAAKESADPGVGRGRALGGEQRNGR